MFGDQLDSTARRRPSISDVALAAGVSRAAVSKVIRDAYGVSPGMRERVQTAIDQLNYRPRVAARAMRGQSFTIGFEIPHLGNDFFTQVMEGAATSLSASKYQLIVSPGIGYLSGSAVLDALVDRQVDGIIALASGVAPEWLEKLAEHVPLVVFGRHDRSPGYDTVTGNDTAGTNLVMDHLLGLGHRRIAHLTIRPPSRLAPHPIRASAYKKRMKQAGAEPQVIYCHSSEEGAYETAAALLGERNRPTAIFAGHDTLAIGTLRAVAECGLTADDVSVVGYDDIALARHPLISLTTVDQSGIQMGVTAVEMLTERIHDRRKSSRQHQTEPRLRVRGSSRPNQNHI